MPRIIFPEFRDQYEHSRYPFADTALLTTQSTEQTIDRDVFLDGTLYPIGNSGRLHISEINIETREVTIRIAIPTGTVKCFTAFDPVDAPDILLFEDEWGRPAGMLVSEALRLARFSSWPVGLHTFAPAATEFVPSVVIPTPEIGVRGVLTENNELFTGDMWIVGDNGVVVTNESEGVIRVDIVGDPLFLRRLCLPVSLFTTPNFIRTINGCPPDEFGNYNLTVGDHENEETIVRIYPGNDGLVIEAIGQRVRGDQ